MRESRKSSLSRAVGSSEHHCPSVPGGCREAGETEAWGWPGAVPLPSLSSQWIFFFYCTHSSYSLSISAVCAVRLFACSFFVTLFLWFRLLIVNFDLFVHLFRFHFKFGNLAVVGIAEGNRFQDSSYEIRSRKDDHSGMNSAKKKQGAAFVPLSHVDEGLYSARIPTDVKVVSTESATCLTEEHALSSFEFLGLDFSCSHK